jgi:hypothetical protein
VQLSEAKHIFRAVFHATSELRLMEKPGDEALAGDST